MGTGTDIIPIAIYNNKVYLLFGREARFDNSKFTKRNHVLCADFGGGREGRESKFTNAKNKFVNKRIILKNEQWTTITADTVKIVENKDIKKY